MNLADIQRRAIDEALQNLVFTATVTGTSGSRVLIRRPTQSTPDGQSWPRLASYTSPQGDDRVLVLNLGAGMGRDALVVLGVIA